MTMPSDRLRGLVLALTGVLVLSPDTLLIRLLESERWVILFWRGLLMALTLGVYFALRDRAAVLMRVRAIGRLGLLAAAFFAVNSILFVTAVTLTSVANTLVIISAAPLFAAFLSFTFLREYIPVRTWVAVTVALAGIALIFSGSLRTGAWLGDLCALGTACFFAGHLTIVRRARKIDMVPTIAVSGLIVAIVATLLAPAPGPLPVSARDFVLLLLLGLVILPVSFSLIVRAPRFLPVAEVSLIVLLEAILGPLWVWLALGETPASETFLGGALVLGTLITHELFGRAARR
jgi:drug/metabolite transporter (DMT)-like permease